MNQPATVLPKIAEQPLGLYVQKPEILRQRSTQFFGSLASTLFGICLLMATRANPDGYLLLIGFSLQTLVTVYFAARHAGLLHPLIIFPLFFYPYSTWFGFAELVRGQANWALVGESFWFASLGLTAYVAAVSSLLVATKNLRGAPRLVFMGENWDRASTVLVANGSSCVAALFYCLLAVSGAGSKQAVLSSGGLLFALATFSAWVAVASAIVVASFGLYQGRKRASPIWLAMAMAMVAMITVGERDHLFRLILGLILVASERWQRTKLVFCLFVVFVTPTLIYASSFAKAYLLQGGRTAAPDFVTMYFENEFIAGGRNLYSVLVHGVTPSWGMLRNDIFRGLLPFGNALGLTSATGWFHTIYRVDNNFAGSAGWGLGYASEGVICGGAKGVAVVFALVGIVVSLGYRFRVLSPRWLVFYVLLCTSAVYSMRADIASLLSMGLKIGGAAVFVSYAVSCFVGGRATALRIRRAGQ